MQTLTVPILSDGVQVDVLVGIAAPYVQVLRQSGMPIPAAIAGRALIDTGAEASCADPQLLAPLIQAGLPRLRFVFANVPVLGGINMAAEYATSLTIVHPSGNPRSNLVLCNLPVVEQSLGTVGYQFLLGRDVLAHCLHVYDWPGGLFTLAY